MSCPKSTSRREVSTIAFGNALPVNCAISPTTRAGCANDAFCNATLVNSHVSGTLPTTCADLAFGNASGRFRPRFQYPDARPATAASDPRSPALDSASGSPAAQTTAANSCACAPSGSQTFHNIFARPDAADPASTTRRSADTYACAFASSGLSSSPHDPRTDHDRRRKSHAKKTPAKKTRR